MLFLRFCLDVIGSYQHVGSCLREKVLEAGVSFPLHSASIMTESPQHSHILVEHLILNRHVCDDYFKVLFSLYNLKCHEIVGNIGELPRLVSSRRVVSSHPDP